MREMFLIVLVYVVALLNWMNEEYVMVKELLKELVIVMAKL